MPYNIAAKFPSVLEYLRNIGTEVSYSEVRAAVILKLGVTKEKTIERYIALLVELGYLKKLAPKVFETSAEGGSKPASEIAQQRANAGAIVSLDPASQRKRRIKELGEHVRLKETGIPIPALKRVARKMFGICEATAEDYVDAILLQKDKFSVEMGRVKAK